MKKRFGVFAAGLLAAIGCLGAFGGCEKSGNPAAYLKEETGNYSDTFKGKVSEQTFESKEKAAEGFLAEELEGKTTKVTFTGYETVKTLSAEEIASLELGETLAFDVSEGEEGKVSYSVDYVSTATGYTYAAKTMASAGNVKVKKIAILKVKNVYVYYVYAASKGENITKSYYDSVFDLSGETNFTLDSVISQKITVDKQTVDMAMSITMKRADDLLYISINSTMEEVMPSTEMYLVNGGKAYMKQYGSWKGVPMPSEYSDFNLLLKSNLPDFVDHTYFEKTATGFTITPQKWEMYFNNYAKSLNMQSQLKCDKGGAYYYVTDGRFSKAVVAFEMKGEVQ